MGKRPFFFRVKEDYKSYPKGMRITVNAYALGEARHKIIADYDNAPVELLDVGERHA